MADRRFGPHPGRAPGSRRTAGPMVAALHGRLVPHAWRAAQRDAYALFHDRSLAMGWLDDRSAGGGSEEGMVRAPGLWAMNDAGWEHPLSPPEAGLVSWFQVEASAVAADRPLPVQPFLRCAEDVTRRAGVLDLTAVRLRLPVQGLDPAARPPYAPVPSMLARGWFDECDPGASSWVEIGVDAGRDLTVAAAVEQLVGVLRRLDQRVFEVSTVRVAGPGDDAAASLADAFWVGLQGHGVTLGGELAEWSCDAVGWVAEVVADSMAGLGLRSPLVLSVVRA